MNLRDNERDMLLQHTGSKQAAESMEEIEFGNDGRYYFVSYVMQQNPDRNYDIALAVHHVRWRFVEEGQGTDMLWKVNHLITSVLI